MLRLLTGVLQGVPPAQLSRIAQELADSTIGDHAILHVLLEATGRLPGHHRVVLTLNRPATPDLVTRYELEPAVYLRVDGFGTPVALPPSDRWHGVKRVAPVPRRRRAARAP